MADLPLDQETAMAVIRRYIADPNPAIRASAIHWLRTRFPDAVAGDLLEQVVQTIEGDRDIAGYEAAEALCNTEGVDTVIAGRIARALKRKDLSYRMRASTLRAIGRIGSTDPQVLQVIRLNLTDRNADVAYAAYAALALASPELAATGTEDLPSALRGDSAFSALRHAAKELSPAALGDLLAPLIADASTPAAIKARALEAATERSLSSLAVLTAALACIGGSPYRLESAAKAYVSSFAPEGRPAAEVLAMAGAGEEPVRAVVAMYALTRFGAGGAFAVQRVTERLAKLSGPLHTDHIGAILHFLQSQGAAARSAAPIVAGLLREDSIAHRDVSKMMAEIVRAFAACTLAEIGAPAQAMPHLIDMVANGETTHAIAAASRAIPRLLERERAMAAPYLLRPLKDDFIDGAVNLSVFAHMVSSNPALNTSARIEAIRALVAINGDALRSARQLLERRAADNPEEMEFVQPLPVRYQNLAADALKAVP
ncbi:MAG: hypothetical protein H0W72_08120 [Planctomycetes bacterium]|nr:hypothetical protein [Planctomycetota bacterium]